MGQRTQHSLDRTTGDQTFPVTKGLVHNPEISLRILAEDMQAWHGHALTEWDKIRHLVETHKGSDLPRLAFESLMETYAEAIIAVADAIAASGSPATTINEPQR
jgi:hypothetical protein